MHWKEVWLPVVVMATTSVLTGLLYFLYISLCLCHPAMKIKESAIMVSIIWKGHVGGNCVQPGGGTRYENGTV